MRELNYTLGIDSITPSDLQDAGFQCEYNATAVVLTLTEELIACLSEEQGRPSWAVEAINAEGIISLYPLSFSESTARFVLPSTLTIPGTIVTLQVAVTMLDDDFNMLKKLYFPAVKVRFGQSVTGALADSEEYDRYARNLVGAMKVAVSAAQVATDSTADATDAAHRAEEAAERAEAAAAEEEWTELVSVTLDEAKPSYSEQIELLGDTTKGVRARVTLPAGTVLPNSRLTAEINLNGNRQMVVRGEGIAQSAAAAVCCFEVTPFAGVWNAQVAPYIKSIGSITGDLTHADGDKVRYFKLQANSINPIPAGTAIEIWGLE